MVTCYIDDIIVATEVIGGNFLGSREVIHWKHAAALKYKLAKDDFTNTVAKCLFRTVTVRDILSDKEVIRKQQDCEVPQNNDCMARYFGFANYYREFTPD